jgi:serine/threonine-protein kinase
MMPVSRDSMRGSVFMENLAWVGSWFGEYDEAFDRLDYLLSIPSQVNVGLLRIDPHWDHVRDHPRFQALLEKYDTEQ